VNSDGEIPERDGAPDMELPADWQSPTGGSTANFLPALLEISQTIGFPGVASGLLGVDTPNALHSQTRPPKTRKRLSPLANLIVNNRG
jgi:hypothetical protein